MRADTGPSSAAPAAKDTLKIPAEELESGVAEILTRAGIEPKAAATVASALVRADLEGIPSHGVMLLPLYVERLRLGSVSKASTGRVISDRDGSVVLDAQNILGQLSSEQAVAMLLEHGSARGFSAVAVRNGFHFGTAGYWARMLAEKGFIGIVTSNTRPLMPALGGAEPVVGNNPLAIALPSAEGFPLVLDMAMSESAMGKIRLAAAQGRAIPDTWATDSNGRPTTDAGEAIKGMLLPAAGAKGFGLAFMMDLLCGALSGGGTGGAVRPLYDNLSECYNCSHLFLALDVARFVDTNLFGQSVVAAAQRVRESKRAPGTSRIYAPGDPARQALETNGGFCPLARETAKQLMKLNGEAGADRPFQFNLG